MRRQTVPMHSRQSKSSVFYIFWNFGVAAVHLPKINFENLIPTLCGNHIFESKQTNLRRSNSPPEKSFWKSDPHAGWESHFWKQAKKVKYAWIDHTPSCKILWLFLENHVFEHSHRRGVEKSRIDTPTQHGDHKKNASYRAWGSNFKFVQPLQRENVKIATPASTHKRKKSA